MPENNYMYVLHKLVYEDDIQNLDKYILQPKIKEYINQKDIHGNTPLQLALMLDRRNCAQKLIDSGADTSIRNEFGWSCLDEAAILGDIDLLEKLVIQKWNHEVGRSIKPKNYLEEFNNLLPCLYAQVAVSFRSPVPLIAKICPKDIISIYKKGSKIRIDFHITGLDRRSLPKFLKGNMSILINYLPTEELPVVHLLDHNKKSFQELFPNIPSWSLYDFVYQYCNSTSIVNFNFDIDQLKLKKKSRKMFSKASSVQINGKPIKAEVYKLTNISLSTQERLHEKLNGDRPSSITKTKIIHKKKYSSRSQKEDENNLHHYIQLAKENEKKQSEESIEVEEEDSDTFESDEEDDEDFDLDSSLSSSEKIIGLNDNNSLEEDNDKDCHILDILNNTERIPLNRKTKEQITHMLITGKSEDNKPLHKKDIEFLNNHIEQYLEDIDNDSIDTFLLDTQVKQKKNNDSSFVSSEKTDSTNTMAESRSIESFNTCKFVSHSTMMSTTPLHNYSHSNGNINGAGTSNMNGQHSNVTHQKKKSVSRSSEKLNMAFLPNSTTSNTNTNTSTAASITGFVNSNPRIERIREIVSETQNKLWENQEMESTEYFNSESINGPLHVGRKFTVEYDQHIYKQKIKMYMCKCEKNNFPVSLSQLLPLLEFFLSFTMTKDEDREKLRGYLEKIINNISGKDHFPGKIEIPIMATVFAKLKFKNISTDESEISDELFTLPKDYQPNEVYFKITS